MTLLFLAKLSLFRIENYNYNKYEEARVDIMDVLCDGVLELKVI